jgi:hypothetical protein
MFCRELTGLVHRARDGCLLFNLWYSYLALLSSVLASQSWAVQQHGSDADLATPLQPY